MGNTILAKGGNHILAKRDNSAWPKGSKLSGFSKRIEQKIFHCEIVVDAEKVKREEQAYKPIPVITDFTDADGNDRMKEMIQENYNRIRAEVRQIVADELQRIQSDPELQYLLQNK